MNKNRIFPIILVLLIFLTSCTTFSKKEPKVLIIIEEHSAHLEHALKSEVGVMAQLLEEAGYKVVYASESGKLLGSGEVSLQPDLKLEDVNVNDFVGIALPCLAISVDRPVSPEINRIVTEASAAGKPIAAAVGGVFSLEDAGVLDGKQFALPQSDANLIHVGKYSGETVTQDGNIITSAFCPIAETIGLGKDQTAELTQKLIEAIKSTT